MRKPKHSLNLFLQKFSFQTAASQFVSQHSPAIILALPLCHKLLQFDFNFFSQRVGNGIFISLVKCLADCFERVKEMACHLLIESIHFCIFTSKV